MQVLAMEEWSTEGAVHVPDPFQKFLQTTFIPRECSDEKAPRRRKSGKTKPVSLACTLLKTMSIIFYGPQVHDTPPIFDKEESIITVRDPFQEFYRTKFEP